MSLSMIYDFIPGRQLKHCKLFSFILIIDVWLGWSCLFFFFLDHQIPGHHYLETLSHTAMSFLPRQSQHPLEQRYPDQERSLIPLLHPPPKLIK